MKTVLLIILGVAASFVALVYGYVEGYNEGVEQAIRVFSFPRRGK